MTKDARDTSLHGSPCRKILYEKIIREMFSRMLSSRGYEVLLFEDPSKCPLYTDKKQKSKNKFCADIIISDVKMNQVDGLKFVTDQIKKGNQIKNIALMSGFWTDSYLKKAEKINCKIFHKPLSFNDIIDWLDQCEKEINPERELINW